MTVPLAERAVYEVLYRAAPAWEVGQGGPDHRPGEHCAGDYAGRVSVVRRIGCGLPSLRHMADRDRPVVEMNLALDEVNALRDRKLKIVGKTRPETAPVTLDDRHGQTIAEMLRRNFDDPEAVEALAGDPGHVESALEGTDAWRFRVLVELSRAALPQTVSHTGTGLYAVKETPSTMARTLSSAVDQGDGTWLISSSGAGSLDDTWAGGYINNTTRGEIRAIVSIRSYYQAYVEGDCSTWQPTDAVTHYDSWSAIQAAIDQLWTDQGSATFTASQYVRVFAGTYDENVYPNVGFVGSVTDGFGIIFEGDPAEEVANIVIAPSGGTYGTAFNDATVCRSAMIRHLKFAGSPTSACAIIGAGSNGPRVKDCIFAPTNSRTTPVVYGSVTIFEDCEFTSPGGNRACLTAYANGIVVRNCRITGSANSTGRGIDYQKGSIVEGCTIRKCQVGLNIGAAGGNIPFHALSANNTIYDCQTAVSYSASSAAGRFLNNIVKDCTNVLKFWAWPEEAATYNGPDVTLRNNCFHGYTTFAVHIDASTKTYAELAAMNNVDASGDLDATDPKLTSPATGDFSLAADSPCRHAGHGSGVLTGINGVAYDKYHPSIGGWAAGPAPVAGQPGLSVADDETGTSFTATVTADNPLDTVFLKYRRRETGAWSDGGSRTGSGTVQVTGESEGPYQVSAVASRLGDETYLASPWAAPKAVLVTDGSSEWKKAAAAVASELDSYISTTIVLPGERFDPKSAAEFIEIGRPEFGGGKGRSGEKRVAVRVPIWCVAKTSGDSRDLGAALKLADAVESVLTDADVEIESGRWLQLDKCPVTGEGEENLRQVVQVTAEGMYESAG